MDFLLQVHKNRRKNRRKEKREIKTKEAIFSGGTELDLTITALSSVYLFILPPTALSITFCASILKKLLVVYTKF